MSFHWVQPQVSLFRISPWHSGKHNPMIIASDDPDHSKETIVAYVDRTLEEVLESVYEVNIWSDGPSSQFKNRFIVACLEVLEKKHSKRINWNYFSTLHGKGPVDGIGGATKRQVRNSVLQTDNVVFNSSQLVRASEKVSAVKIVEMTADEIKSRNEEMHLKTTFDNAPSFPGISKVHFLCLEEFEPKGYMLTKHAKSVNKRSRNNFYKEVYRSSPSEDEAQVQEPDRPRVEEIKPGTYVLVKFDGERKTSYGYVAVCQSELENDGEVKIMCLKLVGKSGMCFKVHDSDVSHVSYDHILYLLPTPRLVKQGNRMVYDFDTEIDVYQKS